MIKGLDFTGISVVYFCHDTEGNILFSKRTANCRDEHEKWDIGGGGLRFGEKIEEALRREIKEEYGTEVIDYSFLGNREVLREQEGRRTHWISFDFKVLIDKSKVKNMEPHKHEKIEWFRWNNFPTPLHSQLPFFLEKYKDKLA